MRRTVLVCLMGVVAIGVGVLVAYAADWVPYPDGDGGIQTTAVLITPQTGTGILWGNEVGFATESILLFQDGRGTIQFDETGNTWAKGLAMLYYGVEGNASSWTLSGPLDPFLPFCADHSIITSSGGAAFVQGPTGTLTAGPFLSCLERVNGECPTGSDALDGVYLWGQTAESNPSMTSFIHAGPTGGLDPDQQGDPSPSAAMVVLSPTSTTNDPPRAIENAYVRVQGNAGEGRVTAGNRSDASITVAEKGAIIVQLGSSSASVENWRPAPYPLKFSGQP